MAIKWKKNQLDVINEKEGEILVSASAGSGKTAVMIERLIRLIGEGVPVTNVLCLTFTKAAAKEIQDRLKQSLLQKALDSIGEERENFIRELDRLPFADITTIDGFCNGIVKKYFEQAGEDPAVSVASSDEAKSIAYRSAERVLSSYGERDDKVYMELVDFLGKKRSETGVRDLIIRINEFLSSISGRKEFVEALITEGKKEGVNSYLVCCELERAQKLVRELDSMALNALVYDLPFPEEILRYNSGVKKGIEKGYGAFVERVNEDIPENPNYAKKIYKCKPESKELITALKVKFNKFVAEYSEFSEMLVNQDARELSVYSDKIFELVEALRAEYERALRSVGLIDFAGIENKALECLKIPEVREEISSRYTHVLIDEYQDTNRLQDEILSLCAGGLSVFMVGDAKQSIYEFRHAEPAIFVEKKSKKDIKYHTLDQNFRSDTGIIDAVNKVFESVYNVSSAGEDYFEQRMVTERVGAEGGFFPVNCAVFFARSEKEQKEYSELYSVMDEGFFEEKESVSSEAIYIENKIKELVSRGLICDKEGVTRSVEYGDIAILARSRSGRVKAIIEHLKECNIPTSITEKCYLPYSAEILIHLLKTIDNPLREDSLVCVMLSPLFDFTENELAEYKLNMERGSGFYEGLLKQKELYPKLSDFLNKIEDYKFRSEYTDVASLLSYIISDTEFERKIAEGEGGRGELGELSEYLASLEGSGISTTLSDYLNFFEKYPYFETERTTGSSDAVKFMTMHASKGLEFPVVFLIDMGGQFNNQDIKQNVLLHKSYGLSIPTFDKDRRIWRENFFTEATKRKIKEDNIAQELRLLYVAMTRARNMLFMTGSVKATSEKGLLDKRDEKEASNMYDFIFVARNKDESLKNYINFDFILDFDLKTEEKEEELGKTLTAPVPSEKITAKCEELLRAEYAHLKATQTPAKFTVTGIMKEETDEAPAVTLISSSTAEEGTTYHTVMENLDFSLCTESEISEALDKMLLDEIITKEQRESINIPLIVKVMNLDIIREVAQKEKMKEQGFLLRAIHSDLVKDGVEDEVLLQGVIDLLALGDVPIIIDYKYSGASAEILRERYSEQIRLYKKAVKDILCVEEVRAYLISLKSAEVIEFKD